MFLRSTTLHTTDLPPMSAERWQIIEVGPFPSCYSINEFCIPIVPWRIQFHTIGPMLVFHHFPFNMMTCVMFLIYL